MPSFDWSNAINILLTGLVGVIGGVAGSLVTNRLARGRELLLLEKQWERENAAKQEAASEKLRAELLQGASNPQEAIAKATSLKDFLGGKPRVRRRFRTAALLGAQLRTHRSPTTRGDLRRLMASRPRRRSGD